MTHVAFYSADPISELEEKDLEKVFYCDLVQFGSELTQGSVRRHSLSIKSAALLGVA